ncbi:MAG: sulfatase-like hydrolase/transferase [Bacteroidetes bacterium]|nr:sulfatase-like hydrolase/transferase [Bacteroidota bacterium]
MMQKKRIVCFVLLVSVFAMGVTTPAWASEKPNVVIFLMDDLDFSGMGAGYDLMEFPSTERLSGDAPEFPLVVTPNIDKLVHEGLIFNRFYITSPVCTPCRYSLLTGRYASTAHNLSSDFAPGQTVHNITWNTHVKPGQYNLSKMLKSVGYRTGIAGKMHCEDGYKKMRAIYQKYTNENPLSPEAVAEIAAGHWEFVRELKELYQWDYAERVYSENADASHFPPQLRSFNLDWCTQGALEFIEENQTKPFFLYFPVNFPHGVSGAGKHRFRPDGRVGTPAGILDEIPGVLPDIEETNKQILAAGGDPEQTNSLTMIDYALGAIDQKLRETGNYDNTIFIYLSDHQKVAKNTPHEGARVPCVIRWPEKIKQQGRSDALCANIDLLATLAQIVGAQIPKNAAINGESFAPLLLGENEFKGRDQVLLEINYARALIQGDYKYIEYFAPDKVRKAVVSGQTEFHRKSKKTRRVGWYPMRYNADRYFGNYFDPVQLCNLKKDPFEKVNLADKPEYESVIKEMRTDLVKQIEVLKKEQAELVRQ